MEAKNINVGAVEFQRIDGIFPTWYVLNHTTSDVLPKSKDEGVLVEFDNGSIETVHIQDFFDDVTSGFINPVQTYTKMYLQWDPKPIAWMPLPKSSK